MLETKGDSGLFPIGSL